jgi:hypothetical protein
MKINLCTESLPTAKAHHEKRHHCKIQASPTPAAVKRGLPTAVVLEFLSSRAWPMQMRTIDDRRQDRKKRSTGQMIVRRLESSSSE